MKTEGGSYGEALALKNILHNDYIPSPKKPACLSTLPMRTEGGRPWKH